MDWVEQGQVGSLGPSAGEFNLFTADAPSSERLERQGAAMAPWSGELSCRGIDGTNKGCGIWSLKEAV